MSSEVEMSPIRRLKGYGKPDNYISLVALEMLGKNIVGTLPISEVNYSQISFGPILITFICDFKFDIIMCEPHCVKLFFINLVPSPAV